MNVRQLSYFMEVYRQGSIAGAARTLFISPQGISKTILSLEEELSVELFIRKGRKLIPTQDAIALTRHAQNLLDEYEAISQKKFLTSSVYKHLHIACSYDVLSYLPWEFYRDFMAAFPDIILRLEEFPDREVLSHMDQNMAELGMITGPLDSGKYHMVHLFTNGFCLLIHKSHPLAEKSTVTLKDLSKERVAIKGMGQIASKSQASDYVTNHAVPAFTAIEVSDYRIIHELAEQNLLIGMTLDYLLLKNPPKNCVIRPFPGDTAKKPIYLVSKKDITLSREALSFREYMVEWLKTNKQKFSFQTKEQIL
ncbi:MAG: LysR family transcriptional regulator [Lachnospiraceae bacterium]|uniref:LysR family transcriptional regulator n=1 Tax=Roseburia sp. 1XD42-69 TaxID=2320088 RepID=UPI000EA312C4|nr:LysR family transcriptional regulator [Roseburia sp. 1XD42-69]MCI8875562.1 LysR family transcriptional regulator [Lachnospiraceae bacterium]MCX4318255.1 LysR family transcriptional regulator [Lachnospiraceae bacterium]RKJ65866.1 LysR family transcriptional regulator [Roseburia sp. 1XD42-69]